MAPKKPASKPLRPTKPDVAATPTNDGAKGPLAPVGGGKLSKLPADVKAATTGARGGGSFSLGLYYTQGYGTASSFGLIVGNESFGTPYGAYPNTYPYGAGSYWSACYGYGGYGHHGHGHGHGGYCGYAPLPWWSPYRSYGCGYGYGYGGYPWYVYRYGGGIFNYAYYRHRYAYGFGFSYSPYYGGFSRRCRYPYYRRYGYYPYSYYATASYYPAYTTVYHSDSAIVDYDDVSDPYVEFVDAVPAAPAPVAPVPEAFLTAFATPFPEGLTGPEYIARGAGWMKDGRFLMAAEAYRRAWTQRPGDHLAPLKLGSALLGAGGRYGLAGYAIHEGLDRSTDWLARRDVDLRDDFSGPAAFDAAVGELKKHIVRNPTDGESRFLLGYALFFSGDHFGAHKEFSALKAADWKSAHVQTLLDASEARLLGAPR
ncbi:MAG: hypothetical protein CL908_23120 [Deltaproteobacteria bacterium]|nr:hypothetical protein [Deltaproteobacteria bacterium]